MPCKIKKKAVPAKAGPACLAGLASSAASNKIKRKIDQLAEGDSWLFKYYKEGLSKQKTSKNEEKAKFIDELFKATNLKDSEYFSRLKKDVVKQTDASQASWMSWTKLMQNEDPVVVALSIKQKKILVRPSSQLDHDDAATLDIPIEHRQEYRYVQESELHEHIDERELIKRDDGKPTDPEAEAEAAVVAMSNDIVQSASKALRLFKNQRDEIQARVTSFSRNEYLGLTRP